MSELHHECGIAAIYHLPGERASLFARKAGRTKSRRLMPRMLLDLQNRGQLAAGMTTYNPDREQLLDTYKEVGTVIEVFRLSHRGKYESLMQEYAGRAAIGHVRYATCGAEDRNYAQPFERQHGCKSGSGSRFALQRPAGQLRRAARPAPEPRPTTTWPATTTPKSSCTTSATSCRAIDRPDAGRGVPPAEPAVRRRVQPRVPERAWATWSSLRDPLGFRPLCYAKEGPLFAAASESVAAVEPRLPAENIKSLAPGEAILIAGRQVRDRSRFAGSRSGRPTASSSGSTSPTSPARSTTAASICRARRWARNWPAGAGQGRVPLDDGHDRRAGARHGQGGGRRDGLRARRAVASRG